MRIKLPIQLQIGILALPVVLALAVTGCGGSVSGDYEYTEQNVDIVNIKNSALYRYHDKELNVYCWGNSEAIDCMPESDISHD